MVASEPEAIAAFVRLYAPHVARIGLETGATSTWRWTELNRFAGDRTTVDRDDARLGGRETLNDVPGHQVREVWICGEVAEGEHGVRLAAAHGLLEFEDRLSGGAGKTLESLSQQGPHAARDVGLSEESLGGAGLMTDEVLEALDLVAERVVYRLGVEPAGVLNRL